MGKHFNSQAYREWERQQSRLQDAYFEVEPEPTADELESQADDAYWERLDAVARYAVPVRVALLDEVRRMG